MKIKRTEYEIMLGNHRFASKKELTHWIKNLLRDAKPPVILQKDTQSIISELITYHPKAEEKIGVGIHEIWIERNPSLHSGNRFIIKRSDGSHCDFSYKYCLGKELPSYSQRVREAMRNAVRPYIMKYREKYFLKHQDSMGYSLCEVSSNKIRPCGADVDHIQPYTFEYIVQKFLKISGINFINIGLDCMKQKSPIELLDNNLKMKLIRFHNKTCKLRIVDKSVHKEFSKKSKEA